MDLGAFEVGGVKRRRLRMSAPIFSSLKMGAVRSIMALIAVFSVTTIRCQ